MIIELSSGETIANVFVFGANNGGGGLNLLIGGPDGRCREVSLSDVYRFTQPDKAPDQQGPRCAGGCGLAPEPGGTMCHGCREGHERDRPLHPDQEFAPEPAEPIDY